MKATALLVLLLLSNPAGLRAQVTARQGTPDVTIHEFKSPMILDLPLEGFRDYPWQASKEFKEVQTFYCEDLVLSQLAVVKMLDGPRRQPSGVRLEMRGAMTVRPSYDRWATLRFDVMKGEARFATVQTNRLSAEEGRTRPFTIGLRLAIEDFERLFGEGPAPQLRVTVTVENNS